MKDQSLLEPAPSPRALRRFGAGVLVLVLLFAKPLYDWMKLALESDLYSYVLLVPFLSAYFLWHERARLAARPASGRTGAMVPLLLGLAAIAVYGAARWRGQGWPREDELALMMFSFVAWVVSWAWWIFGGAGLRSVLFPFGFLVFMIPFPTLMREGLERFLQHSSADAADLLLRCTGTSFVRQGLVFRFTNLTIRVAQECSGIRSSVVLFLTSLLAGRLFLTSPWRRTLLAVVVIPLGILRNGIRILTLVLLSLHVSPGVIYSPLHTRGGPLFFVLSLIPFFLLLAWLRKIDRAKATAAP